jgi:4-hydroxyphenylpyruvate dioxygenase-like putative hemolysin
MAYFDDVIFEKYNSNFKGYTGNPPENKAQYDAMDIWGDKTSAPSWEEISQDIETLKVKSARAKQYPSVGEQLDMLWHAIDSGKLDKTTDFYTALKAVKEQNPYGV